MNKLFFVIINLFCLMQAGSGNNIQPYCNAGDCKNGYGELFRFPELNYRYYGYFVDSKPNGDGYICDDNDNKIYTGEFENGQFNGNGMLFSRDTKKVIYIGKFKNGKRNGHGTAIFKDSIYDGEFENDIPSGYGVWYNNGLLFYKGQIKYDEYNGIGTSYWANGLIEYSGSWLKDKKSGKGSYYNSDGTIYYEGYFENDLPNGYGIMYNKDGSVKSKGIFKDGKLQ